MLKYRYDIFYFTFALSIIGVSETAYLIRKRMLAEAPVCPIGGGCEMVLTSKYNKIFFVPNDMLGFLSYVIMAFLIAFFCDWNSTRGFVYFGF